MKLQEQKDLAIFIAKREALVTEREGMLAENAHRADNDLSVAYDYDAFIDVANRMVELTIEFIGANK